MTRLTPGRTRRMLRLLGVATSLGVLAAACVTGAGSPQQPPGPVEPDPAPPAAPGPPRLEVDGRYFTAGGKPFFWLGDTAWALLGKLDREESIRYLDARKEQGYNVIQTVAIFPQAGADRPITGDVRSVDRHGDFWDNLEFVIDAAAQRGMYLAVHPVWGDDQTGSVVRESNAAEYGRFLGERFGDKSNVTWTLGGDHPADGEETLWGNLADGLLALRGVLEAPEEDEDPEARAAVKLIGSLPIPARDPATGEPLTLWRDAPRTYGIPF